jgi:chromosome partitioning protein
MIVTIGGIKGGSGKSTLATSLVVLLSNAGRDVLLVDADDQGTSTDFTSIREETRGATGYTAIKLSGNAVRTEITKLSGKYQDIIIDTGGRDTTSQRAAMVISDIYIVPFIPRSFDMWTLESVVKLIGEMQPANERLRSFAVLNKTDSKGSDNADARGIIEDIEGIEYLDAPIGHRKSFANAASAGLGVTEYKTRDPKAIDEIKKLLMEIQNLAVK